MCQRARNFLIAQFNTLRKPKSNFQIYQENVLLRFKPLVSFLRNHHLQTYIELTKIYADQMEDVYDERLKTYFKDTAKLIARAPRSSEFLFASLNENETVQFNADTMNTTVRDEDDQVQRSRSDILSRLTAQPIVMAISSQKH